jgi:hypothetical protein
MGAIRKYGRWVIRGIGVLFVLIGLYLACWWFYKLAPMRHTCDPEWCGVHSAAAGWKEMQKSAERGMWQHDVGILMGQYGNKAWAARIVQGLTPDTDMSCFGNHKEYALCGITNQDAGSAEAWIAWWAKNKNKSQLEWIRDGFAERGVALKIPCPHEVTDAELRTRDEPGDSETEIPRFDNAPTHEQIEALLTLLGTPDPDVAEEATAENQGKNAGVPDYVKYNAFRWLRDTDFDPIEFLLSNKTVSVPVQRGVREYAAYQHRYPEQDSIGILPFDGEPRDGLIAAGDRGQIATPRFQRIAMLVIFLPLCLGAVLIALSLRRKSA